jgi:hypothetical protein
VSIHDCADHGGVSRLDSCAGACFLQGLIAASDLYGEGYVDMDEFLAAMVANSNYSKTKDAVSCSV